MPKNIYTIVGKSGAGKDTLAEQMACANPNLVILSPSAPGKRLFERVYDLAEGTMDDRVKRNQVCAGTGQTYLERFIYWFHRQDRIFPPGYFLEQFLEDLANTLAIDDVEGVIITGVRTPAEIKALISLVKRHSSFLQLVPVEVKSHRASEKSSDCYLDRNMLALAKAVTPRKMHTVHNNFHISHMKIAAVRLLAEEQSIVPPAPV